MTYIITQKHDSVEKNWTKQVANSISDPKELLELLQINPLSWKSGFAAKKIFAQRVPKNFINRMEKGNYKDPLLRQVLPIIEELDIVPNYSIDPLKEKEQNTHIPGVLHKYHNRLLIIVKGGCAINCRYCFRRYFPYQNINNSKFFWEKKINYLLQHPELNEVILSGGDPLMAKDEEIKWIVKEIEKIKHIKRLRIHTRLPVVIPDRITTQLCNNLAKTRLQIIIVTHINHANEINVQLKTKLNKLRKKNIILLNQSVLLKGVNDSVYDQIHLNEELFDGGIIPYYLHVLDKVQGAAHFFVSDKKAKKIITALMEKVSGYLVPKLTREVTGKKSKIPLDLQLDL
ncbi:hypothetical protein CF66_6004 [Candidatus Photodesmus katoptron]|uniref:L-lysine 2,3-aminomutase n=1 Tax=Candidatus Photodesmus katoptron Akat1 TaxID=1236703 RepID=S3EH59_9GAMM|nr:EF-P beta-lysylation protein EpmB [Candidatus Photodesmus katoptron]EPE37523.1 kamA [Candidatus Photodesmus katoptron Akat1]KEY90172.1 hypothetical protein CF66_6004 [Candidatus Photodesmus katoptron]